MEDISSREGGAWASQTLAALQVGGVCGQSWLDASCKVGKRGGTTRSYNMSLPYVRCKGTEGGAVGEGQLRYFVSCN